MLKTNRELMVCECNSLEHIVIFQAIEGDVDEEVYLHVHLSQRSFLQRLLCGIRYIFGYRSRFGDFDEIILNRTKLKELLKSLDY